MHPWLSARLAVIQHVTDPLTGLTWPIPAGGSDDGGDGGSGDGDGGSDDGDGDRDGDDSDDPPDGDAAALGDAGKRALDSMKAKLKSEREARKAAEAERDRLKGAKPKGDDPAPVDEDALRDSIKAEIRVESAQRIAKAEVRAAAKGVLNDADDALLFVDPTKFVSDSGDVDEKKIAEAVQKLAKDKPYLAAQGSRFGGSGDNGPRNGADPEVGPGLPRLRRAYETSQ